MKKNKIIMTGGGSAGHVTPNLALVPKLKELGFEIKYIGSKNGIEKEIITKNEDKTKDHDEIIKENVPYVKFYPVILDNRN